MTALRRLVFLIACLTAPFPALANDLMQDTFDSPPETRWRFFADTVMGGVSRGQATFHRDNGVAYARLSGQVSTANNGGFIQMRRDDIDPSKGATGVRLIARGNTQTYYIHLRTGGTLLPWQYYQAAFDVTPQWREIRLPLVDFQPSGRLLSRAPRAESLKSIGVVAFGRDHDARIELREIGFY